MIILYEYTETAFTNNGLGCLNDATSCVVKETLNSEYELEMEYPVNGIHYSDIQLRRIIFAKPNSYDQAQPFRIYSISKPIGGIVTVNAEHISYDMSGLPVRGALENYAWYVNDVFEHIRNNSVYPCPFTFSSDITEEKKSINLSKPRSVKAFLGTDDGLLSLFGGEWEFDRYKAILHKQRGQNRGVSIEYGKNLTDVTQDEKCSEMYTAVYPYYYREDDGLQRLDDDVVKILDTLYKNVYVLDLTSEFEEMPTQDKLRAKAQEYIKDNKLGEPKVSLKVSFIKNPEVIEALHDVRLGDTVSVKFIKIGVDTTSRCISYEFNVLTEQYNSIELGEPVKTIVDTMTSTNSAIIDTQDNLDAEIDRATDSEVVLNTRIDKTDNDITLEVTRAKGAEESLGSRITQTAESLETEVTRAQGAEESLGSRITQTAESITAEVTRAQGAEESLGSRITQTAESLETEVTRAKGAEESLGSRITQTAESLETEVTRAKGAEESLGSRITQTAESLETEVTRAQGAEESLGSRITQTAESLETEVTRAQGAEESLGSRITQTAESLETEVTRAQGAEESLGSRITQTAESLETEVTRAQGAEESLGSRITQTAESITAEVSRAKLAEEDLDASLQLKLGRDENDQVVSMINASADQIKLMGNRLIVECNNFELDSAGRVHIIDSLLFDSGDATGIEIIGHDGKHNALLRNINLDIKTVTTPDGFKLATKDDILTTKDLDNRYMHDKVSGGSDGTGSVFVHGVYYKSGILTVTTASVSSSDERLKTNVSDMPDLESVYLKFKPKKFRFDDRLKGYDHRWHYGLIAQSVEENLIESGISIDDTGLIWKEPVYDDFHEREVICDEMVYKLDKDELHAMHIQMIQKQHKEIEQLKLENVQIKGELDILKQRLERMEERYANNV